MRPNPSAAVAFAHSAWASDATGYYRLCLGFVGDCWDAHYYGRAIWAWDASADKHPYTGNPADIPLGAPVFANRAGDDFGHVFIAGRWSASGTRIFWSSDVREAGHVDPVPIEFFHDHWGMEILGWTADFNKQHLPLGGALPKPPPGGDRVVSLKALRKAANNDPGRGQGQTTAGAVDDVRIVEQALESLTWLPTSLAHDGSFGTSTVAAYVRWQRRLGFTGKDADGIPGMTSLQKLGEQFHFRVAA